MSLTRPCMLVCVAALVPPLGQSHRHVKANLDLVTLVAPTGSTTPVNNSLTKEARRAPQTSAAAKKVSYITIDGTLSDRHARMEPPSTHTHSLVQEMGGTGEPANKAAIWLERSKTSFASYVKEAEDKIGQGAKETEELLETGGFSDRNEKVLFYLAHEMDYANFDPSNPTQSIRLQNVPQMTHGPSQERTKRCKQWVKYIVNDWKPELTSARHDLCGHLCQLQSHQIWELVKGRCGSWSKAQKAKKEFGNLI